MTPDSPGGHQAMEPWDHPRALHGPRMPSMVIGGHAWPTLLFSVWYCTFKKYFTKMSIINFDRQKSTRQDLANSVILCVILEFKEVL